MSNLDQSPTPKTQAEINKIIDAYRKAEDELRKFKFRWENYTPRPDWYDESLKELEEEFKRTEKIFKALPPYKKNPV